MTKAKQYTKSHQPNYVNHQLNRHIKPKKQKHQKDINNLSESLVYQINSPKIILMKIGKQKNRY